jgi:hypothetical protein
MASYTDEWTAGTQLEPVTLTPGGPAQTAILTGILAPARRGFVAIWGNVHTMLLSTASWSQLAPDLTVPSLTALAYRADNQTVYAAGDPQHLYALPAGASAWMMLPAKGEPVPGGGASSLAWDRGQSSMVVEGSASGGSDMYDLVGGTWVQDDLSPRGNLRMLGEDRTRGLIAITNSSTGTAGAPHGTGVWQRLGGLWTRRTPLPFEIATTAAFYDPFAGRTIVVGMGSDGGVVLFLERSSATPLETCVDGVDADGDGLAGCADPDCEWTCAERQ